MDQIQTANLPRRRIHAIGGAPLSAPRPLLRGLHVLTLSAFALAQPIYDRASEKAGFLSDRGVEGPTLIVLVLLLSVVVPVSLFLVEWCLKQLSVRGEQAARLIVNDILLTSIAIPFFKRLDLLPGFIILALGLAAGVAGAWCYERFVLARRFVTVASPGAVLFPLWFLFLSSARGILLPPPEKQFEIENPVPVVMIVFDEFCGDSLMDDERELDGARFPGFAELAQHATWFRNATSVHPMTEYAVPALLSGNYSNRSKTAPVVANYPQNLFTALRNSNRYELTVFEPVTRLCPDNYRQDERPKMGAVRQLADVLPTLALVYAYHLWPNDRIADLPAIPRAWFGLIENMDVDRTKRRGVIRYSWGHNRDEQFAHFLDCITETESPTLSFCHFLIPHVPWCYLPSGRKYVEDGTDWDLFNLDVHGESLGDWGNDELYIMHNQARYLLQLGFADRLIGRLIERLKQTGLYDRCLLIVTADHGVSFREDEARRWLSEGNLQDLMPVPLFIKRPGQETGSVSDKNVESIDILPTIADVLGASLPVPVDGWSVFDETRPERPRKTMHDTVLELHAAAHPVEKNSARMLQLRRFGSGATRPNGLFETGPHPELIGRPVSDFDIAAAEGVEIELTRCRNTPADEAAGIVPCHLEGIVHGKPARPVELAISVGGKIRAVTRTYLMNSLRDTWTALIPESSFEAGNNAIEVFVVSSPARKPTLSRPILRRSEQK